MALLKSVVDRKSEDRVTKRKWSSGTKGTDLIVTLKYNPSVSVQDRMKQAEIKVAKKMNYSALVDTEQTNKVLQLALLQLWSESVIAVHRNENGDTVLLKDLLGYLPFDMNAIKELGLDSPVEMDRSKNAEEAAENIFQLVDGCPDFKSFVEEATTDIGYFQDVNEYAELGNSDRGQNTNLA